MSNLIDKYLNSITVYYEDIYSLEWDLNDQLQNVISSIENCETAVAGTIKNMMYVGEAADAMKAYLADIHLSILGSFREVAQSMLNHMAIYKNTYNRIDSSTCFLLDRDEIDECNKDLQSLYFEFENVKLQIKKVLEEIEECYSPPIDIDDFSTFDVHEELYSNMSNIKRGLEDNEGTIEERLTYNIETIIEYLESYIMNMESVSSDISSYSSDDYELLTNIIGKAQYLHEMDEDYKETFEGIWEFEEELKDKAEQREVDGIQLMVGGVCFILGAGITFVSGGFASEAGVPLMVYAGEAILLGCGIAKVDEGIQEYYYGSKGDLESTSVNFMRDYICLGDEELYNGLEYVSAAICTNYVFSTGISYYSQSKVNETGSIAEKASYDNSASEALGEVNCGELSGSSTYQSGSNTGAGEYAAPSGGGGVTSTIKANGQTVNFGHGGRHLEGTGLNVDAVNQALANEVSTLNLGTGQFHKGQIIVDGITIEYTSYGVSEGIINVGTYYPLQ